MCLQRLSFSCHLLQMSLITGYRESNTASIQILSFRRMCQMSLTCSPGTKCMLTLPSIHCKPSQPFGPTAAQIVVRRLLNTESMSQTTKSLASNPITLQSRSTAHKLLCSAASAHNTALPLADTENTNSLAEEPQGFAAILNSSTQNHCLDNVNESLGESTLEAAMAAGLGHGLLAFYSDHEEVKLPDGHRFPMDKYRETRLVLEGDPSLRDILTTHPSPLVAFAELTLVHDEDYVRKVVAGELSEKEQRATGFPWSPQMVRRSFASTGGTVAAMYAVMLGHRKAAAHIAGGTHHAFRGHGEGFCVFNDIAVASAVALREYPDRCHLAAPILVVDLDVHQGNGTARIFEEDDRVITFSMHGANNYPWRTKMRSNYDVELQDKTGDEEYLAILGAWIKRLFEAHRPSLVFFQAGVDALKEDSFGRLALTRQGLLKRNNMVYSACLVAEVPLVITMGGGYSRPNDASILAHADVYRSAAYRYSSQYGLKPYSQVGGRAI